MSAERPHALDTPRPLPAAWEFAGRLFRSTPHFKDKWRLVNLVARWVRGKGYTATIAFDRGQLISIDLDDWISYQIFLTGQYDVETHQTAFFRDAVKDGMTVLDVGAHIGYYTLQAAVRVGETGRVHAFEPSSGSFQRLSANLKLNRLANVAAFRRIVHSEAGSRRIIPGTRDNTSTARVVSNPDADAHAAEVVACVTLDGHAADTGLSNIDVIKIDVEGSELAVLKGAQQLLTDGHPRLLIELAAPWLAEQGTTPRDIIQFLAGFGFKAWKIGGRGLSPLHDETIKKESLALFEK